MEISLSLLNIKLDLYCKIIKHLNSPGEQKLMTPKEFVNIFQFQFVFVLEY